MTFFQAIALEYHMRPAFISPGDVLSRHHNLRHLSLLEVCPVKAPPPALQPPPTPAATRAKRKVELIAPDTPGPRGHGGRGSSLDSSSSGGSDVAVDDGGKKHRSRKRDGAGGGGGRRGKKGDGGGGDRRGDRWGDRRGSPTGGGGDEGMGGEMSRFMMGMV